MSDGRSNERRAEMLTSLRYFQADVSDFPAHLHVVRRNMERLDFGYGEPDEMRQLKELHEKFHAIEQEMLRLSLNMEARYGRS